MFGPAEAPYPGTPVVSGFLCVMAAVYYRSAVFARQRRLGVTGQDNSWANAIVMIALALFLLVILWAMWIHR